MGANNEYGRPRRAALPDDAAVAAAFGDPAAKPAGPRMPSNLFREPDPAPAGPPKRRHLRSSILLTLASAIIPGSGLLGAPRRGLKILGAVTTVVALAAVAGLGYLAATDLPRVARFAANTRVLTLASAGLVIGAIVWVALIVLTQVATRPAGLRNGRRLVGAIVVTALAFGVAAPTAVAARYARDTTLAISNVFQNGGNVNAINKPSILANAPDPWVNQPRVNILLLGADGSASRADAVAKYSIRTDTIMVASIDTLTGDTTLIQIPRNVQFTPFPEGSEMAAAFPDGFRGPGDPGEWYVNTIWQHVELDYPNLMKGSDARGADALKQGVEGITGLEINQFVLLNIDGLEALIDAMGGVTVNINQRLGKGGNTDKNIAPKEFLEPGPNQHLMGRDAMWYARSRWQLDDYNRMARQSCLIDAIVKQANPQTLLTNFEPIATASSQMLMTDIGDDQIGAYIDLAFRVKESGSIQRLVFSNGKYGYAYADPDFEKMHEAVAAAVAPAPAPTKAPAATTPAAPGSAAPSVAPSPTATAGKPSKTPNEAEAPQTITDACAYQPVE